jgi:hypothetical protein
MEQITSFSGSTKQLPMVLQNVQQEQSGSKTFIEANTVDIPFTEIKEEHIIPVFVKDNEPLISHAEFIGAAAEITANPTPTKCVIVGTLDEGIAGAAYRIYEVSAELYKESDTADATAAQTETAQSQSDDVVDAEFTEVDEKQGKA